MLGVSTIKAERKQPPGLLKQLEVPDWKWEHITMDFISGLPSVHNRDDIWVIVDKGGTFLTNEHEDTLR